MGLWEKIYANCKDLIDNTLNNVLIIRLRQNEKTLDLFTQPTSLFNGSYSLKYNNINSYAFTVSRILDYDVNVILQISYEYNRNDVINSYNNILADIEKIINHRLDFNYFGTEILMCNLINAPAPREMETSNFVVWELTFNITGRVII